jgi:hypothetical protein
MPPAGFEPTISAGERPKTYALDRTAAGTGCLSSHEGFGMGRASLTPDLMSIILLKEVRENTQ